MKNMIRYIVGASFLTSAVVCLSGGFQQFTSSASFLTVAELLFGGALLLLIDGLGLLFDRAWVTWAWGGTLLYYVAASLCIYVIPEMRSGSSPISAHHFAGLHSGQWGSLLAFLILPLAFGLALLRLLRLILGCGRST